MRIAAWIGGAVLGLAVLGYGAYRLSPWPSALFYRYLMNRGGEALSQALERHVPKGVAAVLDQSYGAERLDVFYPAGTEKPLSTIVWVHGGGFFSGSKDQVANYLRILAAKGFTVVGVDYSLAPGSRYPTPVRQVNAALRYLMENARRLRVDPARLVLAGDSAGAQIAAQVANIASAPSYAKAVGIEPAIRREQLRAVLLYCGVYDLGMSKPEGPFAHFLTTVVWSYGGHANDISSLEGFSVLRHVTAGFPPAFVSAGNGDPLLPQSRALAEALAKQGVRVDTLFFADDRSPALPHEYQFNLDTEAGREALERSLKFLASA